MKTKILITGIVVIIAAFAITITKARHKVEKPVEVFNAQPQTPSEANKPADVPAPTPPLKTDVTGEHNKLIARRFYDDVVNKHNLALIDSYAAPEYVEHQYDTHFAGDLKGMKKAFAHYFIAFPDMHVKVNFMMVEGNLVATQITTTGTNTGPIYGRPGRGKKIDMNGVDIVRFKDGKVVEHWGYAEEGKMLSQLGLIGPLIKAGKKEERSQKKRAVADASGGD
jgi:predicted ester cyclase